MTSYYGPKRPQVIAWPLRVEQRESAWNNQSAGQALNMYQVVFRDGDFWKPANARVPTQARPPVGVVITSAASGGATSIWTHAIISNGAWSFTSGQRIWLASGGGIVTSAPTASGDTQVLLGWAVDITTFVLNPIEPVLVGS